MKKNSLTITVLANMTSNYGESLGNVTSIKKFYKNAKIYGIRSKESIKNALMVQSKYYDSLDTDTDGKVTQKKVDKELNISNCRALEGGYMNTKGNTTIIRKSSFYVTDAISINEYINDPRFSTNLYLASVNAKKNNISLYSDKSGLMPYNYEFDKNLKLYSLTIDLEMIGEDDNFDISATKEEKISRVLDLLNAVKNLSLVVKGNLDNAEPIFIVGGLCERKTHYFENCVNFNSNKLIINNELKDRVKDYKVGYLESGLLSNESEIIEELKPISITSFFENLESDVRNYYEG